MNLFSNNQPVEGLIEVNDGLYPKKLKYVLGRKAPSQIYYKGNLDLFNCKSLGFCGSRKATLKGIETAIDCVEQAVKQSIVIVSGYASGVDLAAHATSLANGGSTIIVLPEGINNFRIKKEVKSCWDWSRILVLSQYEPDASWQAFRAMARNHTIIGLSDAMIVIEAGIQGGTIEAGKSSLRLNVPLFVAEYLDMKNAAQGNAELLSKGASTLKKGSTTMKANLTKVFSAIDVSQPHDSEKQQYLFAA
jgi:DNA processing protein